MKYEYCPNDPTKFATNLRKHNITNHLIWDNANGQDVIIIQTPFGQKATEIMNEICMNLSKIVLQKYVYTEIMSGIWVCYVSAVDKAKNNGCPLNGEASTYTVFSCYCKNENCEIYKPKEQSMISTSIDIPMEVRIEIHKQMELRGFLRKKESETGYYTIDFPADLADKYKNGSIAYSINGFEVPVTKEMLKNKTVYVKAKIKPTLIAKYKGLKVIV